MHAPQIIEIARDPATDPDGADLAGLGGHVGARFNAELRSESGTHLCLVLLQDEVSLELGIGLLDAREMEDQVVEQVEAGKFEHVTGAAGCYARDAHQIWQERDQIVGFEVRAELEGERVLRFELLCQVEVEVGLLLQVLVLLLVFGLVMCLLET